MNLKKQNAIKGNRILSRNMEYSKILISCAIIVMFSTRTFRNLDLGMEWVLKCKAMELESLRCTVNRLESFIQLCVYVILLCYKT